MGFSGGGANVLKAHTHDGTVVQDGGSLNFDNITQAALTAGDVIYSDGVHLQRLAIGAPSQALTVNPGATAPEYTNSAAPVMTTNGDMVYQFTGARSRLPPGNPGDLLTMGATYPAWTAPAGGAAWTVIQELTGGNSFDINTTATTLWDDYRWIHILAYFNITVSAAYQIQFLDDTVTMNSPTDYSAAGLEMQITGHADAGQPPSSQLNLHSATTSGGGLYCDIMFQTKPDMGLSYCTGTSSCFTFKTNRPYWQIQAMNIGATGVSGNLRGIHDVTGAINAGTVNYTVLGAV